MLYARLTAADTVCRFAARLGLQRGLITGTIPDISHTDDVTSISIEIVRADLPDTLVASDQYKYMINREIDGYIHHLPVTIHHEQHP